MLHAVFLSHYERAGVVLCLSTHCLQFSTALISNSELTSLNDIGLIPQVNKRRNNEYNILLTKRVGVIASVHFSNQRYYENVAMNSSKLSTSNSSSVNCALHARTIVDGLGKNYANLQAVVKICQLLISELSTVIDSTNQILISGAGIMERRHQWNAYKLPCALPPHQTALGSSPLP